MDSTDPQYSVTVRNLNFEPIVEYDDIVADGFINGTTIKWMLRANKERLEISLTCFALEYSTSRQTIVDDQQAKYVAEQVAQQVKYDAEQASQNSNIKQYTAWQETIKQAQEDAQKEPIQSN